MVHRVCTDKPGYSTSFTPPILLPVPVIPQSMQPIQVSKLSIDKIRKYGAEAFQATAEDDPEGVEFWLENTIRVFNELSCISVECVKCARFLDQKRKEFLELKQGYMTVSEYEREFVKLSKYARKCIPTKTTICKRFKEGLNEYIKLLVEILELKEFVVLVDWAHKVEELRKEKRRADFEARDLRKRLTGMSYQSVPKKSKEYHNHSTTSMGYSSRDRGTRHSSPKPQATSIASVGCVRDARPECKHCNRPYYGECRVKRGARFRCGSLNHCIKDCLKKSEKQKA
ncbi:uncharacterized protein [Gossypium hirsutum]|uniref:Retrotransposon gag domain-containing protein n=1 Tax=Gossypium hirsutum TaxID=3635 RepID=A0A1U8JKG1_GOSHI|nr:uncharacterized protein LOC107908007 [Gossypium hirsutum]